MGAGKRKDGGLFVCAGRNEQFSFATSIGVGLVESAIGLTQVCEEEKPEYIVFIGSAGSYDENLELLGLYRSASATQIESSVLQGRSYTPLTQSINLENQNVSRETLRKINSLPSAKSNSSNYITSDEDIARWMLGRGILLENMELFSVLRVAQEYSIPAVGILCVSNYCNALAREDFIKNHALAKERLEGFIKGLG